ncbi:MAG: hypothetical protein HN888_04000, partial [Desulfobacula sp.]|nr:hypothetical protein [Desulfobacula sp.]
MKLEKLGKHIKQIRGISYKPKQISTEEIEDYLPVIKANNITENGFDDNNLIYIHKKNIKDEQYIQKGDLVLAASSGSKKIIGKNIHFEENYKGSFGAFCKLVRPSKAINSKYLKHFFRTPYYRTTIEKLVQGANINNLKNQHLDNMIVPIPDNYDDQIRIATLLSRVEELIAKRKESIQLLDEFLKSTFLEMFGDPARNEKKWDIDKLKNCMLNTPQNGLYKPQSKYGTGVKIIRIDSFNNSVVDDIDSLKLVKVTEQEKNK